MSELTARIRKPKVAIDPPGAPVLIKRCRNLYFLKNGKTRCTKKIFDSKESAERKATWVLERNALKSGHFSNPYLHCPRGSITHVIQIPVGDG